VTGRRDAHYLLLSVLARERRVVVQLPVCYDAQRKRKQGQEKSELVRDEEKADVCPDEF